MTPWLSWPVKLASTRLELILAASMVEHPAELKISVRKPVSISGLIITSEFMKWPLIVTVGIKRLAGNALTGLIAFDDHANHNYGKTEQDKLEGFKIAHMYFVDAQIC